MTRILFSILFVALLAQTALAASYTFTSTYTSSSFPGGQATVVALGAFDWDTTNGVTNFEFTSVDAGHSGLTLGDYNAFPASNLILTQSLVC